MVKDTDVVMRVKFHRRGKARESEAGKTGSGQTRKKRLRTL